MKYEMLNQKPEISLLHDFISFKESTKLKMSCVCYSRYSATMKIQKIPD